MQALILQAQPESNLIPAVQSVDKIDALPDAEKVRKARKQGCK
jgi:hypothetical protein